MKTNSSEENLQAIMPENLQTQIMSLFHSGIQAMHHAERVIAGTIPSMVINSSSFALVQALEHHMTETHVHILRLENIMVMLGIQQDEMICGTIEVMVTENNSSITSAEKGIMCDTAVIAAAQKTEHFEIASYDTLHRMAEVLGLKEVAEILDKTLEEEKLAHIKLTELSSEILYAGLRNAMKTMA